MSYNRKYIIQYDDLKKKKLEHIEENRIYLEVPEYDYTREVKEEKKEEEPRRVIVIDL